jgi:hypothetical protein
LEAAFAVHVKACPSIGGKGWVEEAVPEPVEPEPVKIIRRRLVKTPKPV